jgi:hypothetical protein
MGTVPKNTVQLKEAHQITQNCLVDYGGVGFRY